MIIHVSEILFLFTNCYNDKLCWVLINKQLHFLSISTCFFCYNVPLLLWQSFINETLFDAFPSCRSRKAWESVLRSSRSRLAMISWWTAAGSWTTSLLSGLLMNTRRRWSKRNGYVFNPFRTKTPKYLFPRGNKPLLYHQIGNRNFFIFITNQ